MKNNANHENRMIPQEKFGNHQNPKITCENKENHENHRILFDNQKQIMKIMEFHTRIMKNI